MTKKNGFSRVDTGVRNLDELFGGGVPKGSALVVAGPPGSGKTILAQQICFHNASPKHRVLYFSTLSEPAAKSLRYLKPFTFFDAKKLEESIRVVDLGVILRTDGLEKASDLIMDHLKKVKPAIVVIDSFKVFDDLAKSKEELRKFGYEIAVNLMAWETTAFLLGEYAPNDYETNPLFSIVDGLVALSQRESSGEHQRFFKVVKLRGTDHSRDEHSFTIGSSGVEVYAPRVAIHRERTASAGEGRCTTGIPKLDELLGPGIPWGSTVLISGVAGTGKTVLSLEFLFRGAQAGEKGILFSFEETEERLRATAAGLGWPIDQEIAKGMIEIVFIPQPSIMVEAHLLMIRERVETLQAKRVIIDSVSVFLHKVKDPQANREKIFHLCSIIQNARAVGFFSTDIPYGSTQISRFGVEETVVDGVILLSSSVEGLERQRYLEVYKLRNTAHLKGRHQMLIEQGGLSIFPRYADDAQPEVLPPALETSKRLPSGIPGLDGLIGGGLLERSVTLVSGSAGVGKTTLAMQFILGGVKEKMPGLYVTLEEGPAQLLASADALGLPLRAAVDAGLVELLYLSREHIRAGQFLSLLADKVQAMKAGRVVLDAAMRMMAGTMQQEDLRHTIYNLVVRFKVIDATSLLTIEAPSLYAIESMAELGLSPIADNLLMLRYADVDSRLVPTLTVIKTRGSVHEPGTRSITLGEGGMRLGALLEDLGERWKR